MTKQEEKYTTLDTEQCKWWVNTLFSMAKEKACNSHNFDDGEEIQAAQDKIIKALEQQPCEDKVTITMDKGTLKYSGQGYVAYNKDWFRKHFAIEVAIMTGYDGYIEQPTSDDCVSREDLLKLYEDRFIELQKAHQQDKQLGVNWCINTLKEMPPVTPTHGTCKDCRHCREDFSFTDKPMCLTHGLITVNDDFYCADFEKRGDIDGQY